VRSRSGEQERRAGVGSASEKQVWGAPLLRPNAAERFLDPMNAVLTLFVPTYFIVSVSVHIHIYGPHTVLCPQRSVSEVKILTVYAIRNATCK
jgi:hypothetical protein